MTEKEIVKNAWLWAFAVLVVYISLGFSQHYFKMPGYAFVTLEIVQWMVIILGGLFINLKVSYEKRMLEAMVGETSLELEPIVETK